ncbi:zinc-binding dehydrogenase-2 [Elsinoe australis]|uniref:Zinc-binding dehydrogenase-2 n=1 Tax=Elsinoe australis TaxID=40998 RepID=A0A4U7BFT6_9PEZI|nr:zinc-binding dehydrogenase-2 [Elsinoe australis]
MATMRAVAIKGGKGPATALHITETPRPTPTSTQALVRVRAFGLNRMDLLQREGMYPVPPQAPSTLGVEFSGVIESVAASAERGFKPGDEVFGLAYGGAYAEYIAVSTHMLVHKPAELSWEECAGIPETWITALQAMYLIGEFAPGKSILWHAGASSVSIAGLQLSRADGAGKVFATARQDEKCRWIEQTLKADKAWNTEKEDWAGQVLEATGGKGVDVIVDFVGGSYFADNLKAAARDARVVNLATLGGGKVTGDADIGMFVRKRLRFEGSSLRSRDEDYQGKLRDRLVEVALEKFKSGEFKSHVEKVFDWEQVVEAHQLMESNKTKGKLICTIKW